MNELINYQIKQWKRYAEIQVMRQFFEAYRPQGHFFEK